MRLLLERLRQRSRLVTVALFCAACSQGLILLDPYILRQIIDGYATQSSRYTTMQFFTGAALLLGAGMGAALFAWIAKSFQLDIVNRITRGVGIQLYGEAIRHSLAMPYSAFETQQTGEIMATIQTARQDVERFLPLLINNVFTSLIAVVFVVFYAARVNWMLAPALLLTVPLLAIASHLLSGKMRATQKQIFVETARLAGSATESLRNIEIVKSLGLASQEVSRFDTRSDLILKMEMQKLRHSRNLTFFHGACVNLLRSGLMFLFLYLVFSRQITVGQFFSLVFYSYFIFSPMQELGSATTAYHEAHASLKNIGALLASPKEGRPARPAHIDRLETLAFGHVTFQYPAGDQPAVRDVSFQAARGETIAFVGPSGSGKTTLVKLLAGLYLPASGEILFNGISATEFDLDVLRERIGLVTQDTQLFSGTIRDNLIFVRPQATDAECLKVLRDAAATELLARADRGLDTVIGEGGVRVSGGEKQRLSIARALLRSPQLLVFDEATSSLDSLTEDEIVRMMQGMHVRGNAITVIIAHRLSTVRHANRIYVLNRGAIVESGSHEDLLRAGGLYQNLWQQQTGGGQSEAIGQVSA